MSAGGAPVWRLLPELASDGARQMATDEALLEGVARRTVPPTVRFYRFQPAALSLGRHQVASRSADLDWCAAERVDVVRRPTGGGGVLHDEASLTYAVAVPLPFLGDSACGVAAVSRRIGEVLRDALASVGVPVELAERVGASRVDHAACFARPSRYEILSRGRKLVGSAQVRRRRAVLQHGSLALVPCAWRHRAATGWTGPLPFTSVSEAAGRAVAAEEVIEALRAEFARLAPTGLRPGDLTPDEGARVERLRAERYLDATWTLEGRPRAQAS